MPGSRAHSRKNQKGRPDVRGHNGDDISEFKTREEAHLIFVTLAMWLSNPKPASICSKGPPASVKNWRRRFAFAHRQRNLALIFSMLPRLRRTRRQTGVVRPVMLQASIFPFESMVTVGFLTWKLYGGTFLASMLILLVSRQVALPIMPFERRIAVHNITT
jgi:hypothetical protein